MLHNQTANSQQIQRVDLDKRLEEIGWALFLMMIGGIWLVPDGLVPEGTWLIGLGLILLGINAARYLNHINMSALTVTLGIIALLVGTSSFLGATLPLFPILLILCGASILLKLVLEMFRERPQ